MKLIDSPTPTQKFDTGPYAETEEFSPSTPSASVYLTGRHILGSRQVNYPKSEVLRDNL